MLLASVSLRSMPDCYLWSPSYFWSIIVSVCAEVLVLLAQWWWQLHVYVVWRTLRCEFCHCVFFCSSIHPRVIIIVLSGYITTCIWMVALVLTASKACYSFLFMEEHIYIFFIFILWISFSVWLLTFRKADLVGNWYCVAWWTVAKTKVVHL